MRVLATVSTNSACLCWKFFQSPILTLFVLIPCTPRDDLNMPRWKKHHGKHDNKQQVTRLNTQLKLSAIAPEVATLSCAAFLLKMPIAWTKW